MSRFDDDPLESAEASLPTYQVKLEKKDGRETLTVIFPSALHGDLVLSCNELLILEEDLAIALAHGFALANLSNEPTTRNSNWKSLKHGILDWIRLNHVSEPVGFDSFNVDLFDQWDKTLKERDTAGRNRFSPSTSAHYRSALRQAISAMRNGEWAQKLADNCRLRKKVITEQDNQKESTDPYDIDTFCKILRAIREDVKKSLSFLRTRTRLLEHGRTLLANSDRRHRPVVGEASEKALLLARMQNEFGPVMPTLMDIRSTNEALYDEIQEWDAREIYAYLHPCQHDLLPFVYQLGVLTAFNPTQLLSLQLNTGIRVVRLLGFERVVFSAFKGRKGDMVTQSFLDTDRELSAPHIVRSVTAWTADIRKCTSLDLRDDFWIYVPRHNSGTREVRSLKVKREEGKTGNSGMINATTMFQKRHSLPRVTIARIRATVAALAHDLFGGDIRAVMDLLQHSEPDVTLGNYTNGVGRARHAEIIATVQQLRERWILSDGKLDPRILAQTGDPAATTAGWQCVDPYNSPIPGQKAGRLCDAYGGCPACPLARVNIQSAVSCARIEQFRKELETTKHRVLPERWTKGLLPLHKAVVDFWLPAFSESIRRESTQLHLSPIVPID